MKSYCRGSLAALYFICFSNQKPFLFLCYTLHVIANSLVVDCFFFLLLLVVFLLFSLFLNAQEANNTLETKNEYAVVLIFYFSLEDEHVKHRFSVVCATCKKKDRKRNFLRDVFIYKYRHLCCLLKK